MSDEEIVKWLKRIHSIGITGDSRSDIHRVYSHIRALIKAIEDGRQSMESVREDSSKVFRLD